MTYKEVAQVAANFSYGSKQLGLVPEVQGEGRKWRFLGI